MEDQTGIALLNAPVTRSVYEMEISLINNATNSIHNPDVGGRFELKQNMGQLLHTNWQFTSLSHKYPQEHI